jgi:hypothetical protein
VHEKLNIRLPVLNLHAMATPDVRVFPAINIRVYFSEEFVQSEICTSEQIPATLTSEIV